MTSAVRHAVAECNTILEFIPGGYTSQLQVMDVGLNKPFKDRVRDQYDGWLSRLLDEGAKIKPVRQDVSIWIANAWKGILPSIVENTWRRIGLPHIAAANAVPLELPEEEDEPEEGGDPLALLQLVDDNDDEDDDDILFPDDGGVAGLVL
jgi:DDE superfamily endonuclease